MITKKSSMPDRMLKIKSPYYNAVKKLLEGTADIGKPRCGRCGSTQVYTRITTQERVCKTCGYIEKMDQFRETKAEGEEV